MDKEKLAALEHFFSAVSFPSLVLLGPGQTISDLPRFLESHFTALKGNCPAVLQEPYFNRLVKLQVLLSKTRKPD
jgi:hypothetical protein